MQRPGLLIVLLLGTILGNGVTALTPLPGDAARGERRDARTAVIGGQAVPDGKYPFMVAVGRYSAEGGLKRAFCGGSLIGRSAVLTAAHCVAGKTADRLAVVIGQTEFGSTQGEVRRVTSIMVHPGFRMRSLINDVAVLRLNQPILSVVPISLVGAGDAVFEPDGTPLMLIGWGDSIRSPKAHFPLRLQERGISVVSDTRCDKKWRHFGVKTIAPTHMVCMTGAGFGAGDSGGPLFSLARGAPVQVSLVSAGSGGTRQSLPDLGPQLSEPGIAAFIASVNV